MNEKTMNDILAETLDDLDIQMDTDKISELAKSLACSIDTYSDMEFEMNGGRSAKPDVDYEDLSKKLQNKLNMCEAERDAYQKSVARRRNVDASCVRIEHGDVMIYP